MRKRMRRNRIGVYAGSFDPLTIFPTKRAEILEQFQKRSRIYSTRIFHDKYEKQARVNLESAIKKLRAMGL